MSIDKEQIKKAIYDTYYADDMFQAYVESASDKVTAEEVIASSSNDETKLWDIFAEEVRRLILRGGTNEVEHEEDIYLKAALEDQRRWSRALGFYEALEECKETLAKAEEAELKEGTEHVESSEVPTE